MKYIKLLALVLVLPLSVTEAQEVDWWHSFGAGSDETITKIERDSKGNFIVLGTYDQIFDIGNNTMVIEGGQEFFLAKFNKSGVVQWARTFTGVGVDQGMDIAIDEQDVIYLAGHFIQKVRINNEVVFAEGGVDGLVMQISSDGFNGWIKNMGGDGTARTLGIWVNATHVYATGDFDGEGQMDGLMVTSNGGRDIWMAKIEKSIGVVSWVKSFGGPGDERVYDIVEDFRDDFYICGSFSGSFALGNQTLTAVNGQDVLFAKLTDEGVPIWAKQAAGSYDGNEAHYLEVDEEANIYVSGLFGNRLSFEGQNLISNSETDGFLMSLNANGGLRWAYNTQTIGAGRLNGLHLLNNKIYIAGTAQNGTLFGSETINNAQGSLAFMAGFSLDGSLQRIGYFDGPGNEEGIDLTGSNEEVTMIGTFEQSLDLDGETATAVGGSDIFVVQIDAVSLTTDVEEISQEQSLEFRLDQVNKNIRVILPEDMIKAKGAIHLWDSHGRLIATKKASIQTDFNLSNESAGVYYVQWSDGRRKLAEAFVLY